MNTWAPHLYRAEGERRGIEPQTVEAALEQANNQISKGFPPILSLGHLAFHTEVPYNKLRMIVKRNIDPYRHFTIKKRSGGKRHICVPENNLLIVQRWIDRNILSATTPSAASYAYHKGKSIYECAQQHCGCRWMIKIDLSNYFESLSEIQAYRVFEAFGYSPLVCFELSRLCTRIYPKAYFQSRFKNMRYSQDRWKNWHSDEMKIFEYSNNFVGHLPQGAPTSPKLSNLIVQLLDEQILTISHKYKLTYTRYADDMQFSTASKDFNKDKAKDFIRMVYKILPLHGLRPNLQKTIVSPPRARKVILGNLVDSDKPRLTKAFKRRLECHLYYCNQNSIRHAEKRGFNSILGLRNYIEGLISYAQQIDKDFIKKAIESYGQIKWPI